MIILNTQQITMRWALKLLVELQMNITFLESNLVISSSYSSTCRILYENNHIYKDTMIIIYCDKRK